MSGNSGVSVMSGYRGRQSFDPNSGGDYGRPMRPFNWVQWTGVALGAIGVIFALAFLLGEMGILPKLPAGSPQPFFSLPVIGMLLVNSRREPGPVVEEEQRQRNQRVLLITTLIVVPILIAAAAFSLLGGR
jgi:hypothetical protein